MFRFPSNCADWQTADDYDPPGADWLRVDIVGSSYDVEIDRSKAEHQRHRSKDFGVWLEGGPPDEAT